MQDTECRDRIPRVLDPAQHAEHVLDVRRLQELEPTILHEGNVAAAEFDLEQGRMMPGAHKDCLPLQVDPLLPLREHLLYDVLGLRLLVPHGHEEGQLLRAPG